MKIALILMTLGIFRLGQKVFFEEFKINILQVEAFSGSIPTIFTKYLCETELKYVPTYLLNFRHKTLNVIGTFDTK